MLNFAKRGPLGHDAKANIQWMAAEPRRDRNTVVDTLETTFQTHFLEWKLLYFESVIIQICSQQFH